MRELFSHPYWDEHGHIPCIESKRVESRHVTTTLQSAVYAFFFLLAIEMYSISFQSSIMKLGA